MSVVWCLLINHEKEPLGRTFKLISVEDVDDIKVKTKARSSVVLNNVDSAQLTVWRCTDKTTKLSLQDDEALQHQLRGLFDSLKVQKLEEMDIIEALQISKSEVLLVTYPGAVERPAKRPKLAPEDSATILRTSAAATSKTAALGVEISLSLLDKWNAPFTIPLDTNCLHVHLDAPLNSDKKIPIPAQEWKRLLLPHYELRNSICDADLGRLFRVSTDEIATDLWYQLHEVIACSPPDPLGTKASFHSFWDRNILFLLTKCLDNSTWVRNRNQGTQTGSLRPDLGLFLDSTCIFQGEERRAVYSGKHPRNELAEKTRWVYDPAPYVLGYYAIGARLTIVAIKPKEPGQKTVVIEDLVTEDLSTRQSRIRNAARIIRLVKVLRTLERVVEKRVDVDMFPLRREQGKTIEFYETKIRKIYQSEDQDRVPFLIIIYNHLKANQVPNVDSLTRSETAHPEHGCFVDLEPRGINEGPKCVDDASAIPDFGL